MAPMRQTYSSQEYNGERKSTENSFVVYPKSVGDTFLDLASDDARDVISTDFYHAFKRNFEMFLRKQKDKNTQPSMHLKLKHEQRLSFVCLTARIGKKEAVDKAGAHLLTILGNKFNTHWPATKWDYDDVLEGFDGSEALIAHLKDLAKDSGLKDISNISEESCKAVKKDLIVSAFKWVVEQLDVALGEFKEFRDGFDEKDRKKYDKLVMRQTQKWEDYENSTTLTHKEVCLVIKDVQKQMDDIIGRSNNQKKKDMDDTIARASNQKKDIDSLVEFIEGKQLGAIPKKKKGNNSKNKNKKNQDQDLPFKSASQLNENTSKGIIRSQQPEGKVEQFKSEASFIDIQHVQPDEEKASPSDNVEIDDELKEAIETLKTIKAQLGETENQLRKEQSKNSQINIKLTSENNLLRAKLLQNDFIKYGDILRQRQKNNFSVIDNLRASPESAHSPEVQLALRSLLEFSARLLLAREQLSRQYASLYQQIQTSNSIPELQFDMADAEPPELGSSCMNLLYRSLLMSQSPIPTVTPPPTFRSSNPSPSGSSLATSHALGRTQSSQAKGSISSKSLVDVGRKGTGSNSSRHETFSSNSLQGTLSSFPNQQIEKVSRHGTGSMGSLTSNGASVTSSRPAGAASLNANPRSRQILDCASSKVANKKVGTYVEGGGASINTEDVSCSICLEDMWQSNSFYLKSCWHRFHTACMKQWLESPRGVSSTCPMCRTCIAKEDASRFQ